MEKLTVENGEFTAEEADHIRELVAKYGATVEIPVHYEVGGPGGKGGTLDALKEMEERWAEWGVHVELVTRWNAFPRVVQEARRKGGLKQHPWYHDTLRFRPEPEAIVVKKVQHG